MSSIPSKPIAPTIPGSNGNHKVRIYSQDYAIDKKNKEPVSKDENGVDLEQAEISESDSDSEYIDNNYHSSDNYNTLVENKVILEEEIASNEWELDEQDKTILVQKPFGCFMDYRVLNPFVYREMKPITSIKHLASILGARGDWEERCNEMVTDSWILSTMTRLREMPTTCENPSNKSHYAIQAEYFVSGYFDELVMSIDMELKIGVEEQRGTIVTVGGLLAKHEYDIKTVVAAETKNHESFGYEDAWHHEERGLKVLSTMYGLNCPTFLITERQWKLFVENEDRTACFTFPFDDDSRSSDFYNSLSTNMIGRDLIRAIVVCLLSKKATAEGTRKSERLKAKPLVQPSFLEKDQDGKNIKRMIRVVPFELK